MGRSPIVGTVAPWIGAGLDRAEAVVAITVGQRTANAAEIRVKRGQVAVLLVPVAATGIGLPHFHQGMGNRLAVLITHATGDNDAFADWQATVIEVQQQIVIVLTHLQMGKIRAAGFGQGLGNAHQCLARGAQDRRLVVRCQGFWMPVTVTNDEAAVMRIRHVGLPVVRVSQRQALHWRLPVAQSPSLHPNPKLKKPTLSISKRLWMFALTIFLSDLTQSLHAPLRCGCHRHRRVCT
ncbi:hypothetical protein D3C84_79950 [compost metagenome]